MRRGQRGYLPPEICCVYYLISGDGATGPSLTVLWEQCGEHSHSAQTVLPVGQICSYYVFQCCSVQITHFTPSVYLITEGVGQTSLMTTS